MSNFLRRFNFDQNVFWGLFFLTITSLLMRACLINIPSLDWDEDIFSIISTNLLSGGLLYAKQGSPWDHKPPGMYLFFSIIKMFLGNSILGMRTVLLVLVTLTFSYIYRLHILLKNPSKLAILSVATFACIGSNFQGDVFNIEAAQNLLYVFALYSYFLYRQKRHSRHLYYSFAAISLAVQFRYDAILIFFAIYIYHVYSSVRQKHISRTAPLTIPLLILLMPFIIFVIYFSINHRLDDYMLTQVFINILHMKERAQFDSSQQLIKYATLFPISVLIIAISILKNKNPLLTFFFIFSFISILLLRCKYEHYFVTASLAISLMVPSCFLDTGNRHSKTTAKTVIESALSILLIANLIYALITYNRRINTTYAKNYMSQIIYDLRHLTPKSIFVYNYYPIIYQEIAIPYEHKYIFPPFLLNKSYDRILKLMGTSQLKEIKSIFANKPQYIVFDGTHSIEDNREVKRFVLNELATSYSLIKTYSTPGYIPINLYKRNESAQKRQ